MPEENHNNGKKPNFYELYRIVGNIEGTLKAMNKRLDKTVEDHEERIKNIEKETTSIKGKAAGAGFVAGAFVSIAAILFDFFKR